jgi:hypothetical protein
LLGAISINQVFDFEASEQDSLAGLAQARGGALRLLPSESASCGNEFGNRSPAAGYYYFRSAFDLVEERAQLSFCFERSDFPHVLSPASLQSSLITVLAHIEPAKSIMVE